MQNIRSRFKKSVPGTVDAAYLTTVLGVTGKSASNYLGQLRLLGLIDAQGKPTDLGRQWRLDDEYAEACREIISRTYPASLLEAVPDPKDDRESAERWFMQQGAGEATARIQAAFLALLDKGDPTGGDDRPSGPSASPKPTAQKKASKKAERTDSSEAVVTPSQAPATEQAGRGGSHRSNPTLHIDLQIHISAESSPEQVDAVFASMAKHIYDR